MAKSTASRWRTELHLAKHIGTLRLKVVAHVVLLLLVAREDADFADVTVEETAEDGVSEGTGASGDKEDFVFKY